MDDRAAVTALLGAAHELAGRESRPPTDVYAVFITNEEVGGGPIVAYSDAECVYDKQVADRLMAIAEKRGMSPQAAVLGAFESDASHSKAGSLAARAGLLCLPTLNTHGYEIIHRDAIPAITEIVVDFVSS